MARPTYAVYKIESFTGSTFSEADVPERLTLVGLVEAVNSDHAAAILQVSPPCLVLRAQMMFKIANSSSVKMPIEQGVR